MEGCGGSRHVVVPVAAFLPQGDEFLPVLARGSERETGYSRVNERLLNPRVWGLLLGGWGWCSLRAGALYGRRQGGLLGAVAFGH